VAPSHRVLPYHSNLQVYWHLACMEEGLQQLLPCALAARSLQENVGHGLQGQVYRLKLGHRYVGAMAPLYLGGGHSGLGVGAGS